MKHYGDITKISGFDVEPVEILVGGSPCQDLSIAGLRKGLKHSDKGDEETTRSGLFMEQIRITKEMRENDKRNGRTGKSIRPRWFVWENVVGATSSGQPSGEDFRIVLEEVCRIAQPDANVPRPSEPWTNSGCIVGHGWSVAWRIHDAQFWGVPQRRRRIALVADFADEGGASEVLFERSRLSGNPAESKGKGERPSRNPADGAGETISFQDRCGCEGGARESSSKGTEPEQSQPLTTKQSFNKVFGISPYSSNAMKSDNPESGIYEADTSRTLDVSGGIPDRNQGGMVVLGEMLFDAYQHGGYKQSEKAGPLTAHIEKRGWAENILAYSENAFSKYSETDHDLTSLRASGGSNGGGTETLILTKSEH